MSKAFQLDASDSGIETHDRDTAEALFDLALESGDSVFMDRYKEVSRGLDIRESIASCVSCSLWGTCTQPVPFRGVPGPVIAVGEAPGGEEDKAMLPFVGPAGRQLAFQLKIAGLPISAYVNTLCCRPPNNKLPSPLKPYMDACRKNLDEQIRFLRPWLIVCFGNVAMSAFFQNPKDAHRGKFFRIEDYGAWGYGVHHPSYACLRNRSALPAFQEDLKKAAAAYKIWREFGGKTDILDGYMKGLIPVTTPIEPSPVKQLYLDRLEDRPGMAFNPAQKYVDPDDSDIPF